MATTDRVPVRALREIADAVSAERSMNYATTEVARAALAVALRDRLHVTPELAAQIVRVQEANPMSTSVGVGPGAAVTHNAGPVFRAAYLIRAAQRTQAAHDQAAQSEAERRYFRQHQAAQMARELGAMRMDAARAAYGRTLGWYSRNDDRVTAACRAADGKNFDPTRPPAIGLPGIGPHVGCRCTPGPPHEGAAFMSGAPSTVTPLPNTTVREPARLPDDEIAATAALARRVLDLANKYGGGGGAVCDTDAHCAAYDRDRAAGKVDARGNPIGVTGKSTSADEAGDPDSTSPAGSKGTNKKGQPRTRTWNEQKHPRGAKGSGYTGGKFVPLGAPRDAGAAAAQGDTKAVGNYHDVGSTAGQDRVGKLAKMQEGDLEALSRVAYSTKTADARVVAFRIEISNELHRRGKKVTDYGAQGMSVDEVDALEFVSGNTAPFSASKDSNWVAKAGGLPGRVRAIARAVRRKHPEWTLSHCIAVAINAIKYSAATGDSKLPGRQNERPDTVASHAGAVAHWEAMKAGTKAKRVGKAIAASDDRAALLLAAEPGTVPVRASGDGPRMTMNMMQSAIAAVPKAKDPAKARARCIAMAKAQGMTRMLPASWASAAN